MIHYTMTIKMPQRNLKKNFRLANIQAMFMKLEINKEIKHHYHWNLNNTFINIHIHMNIYK